MGEGSKQLVINNLERAVSTDINRLQTFKDAALSQVAKWMFGVQALNKELFPGYVTEFAPGALDPYQNSVVVNGLMPYPLNGSTTMFVTPGLAYMEDATYTADQSPYRYVDDPGVDVVGTLVLTTAPGATRIDVIECQLTELVLEQSNRDIFNPATGLFTPTLVDKVKGARLNYRIREGAPGGGFPGVVTGWLPLAVCSVPSAASSWDDVTIWDVRPLLSASHNAPFVDWLQDTDANTFWPTAAWNVAQTQLLLTGKVKTGLGPYDQSGLLGNHPTDSPWIDLANLANWASGAVPIPNFPYYVWALTPFNLPGWRKYSGIALAPRRPSGMAGVMAVSPVAPTARGYPSLPIAPPTATGLGGSTQFGALAACGYVDGAGIGRAFASDGDYVYNEDYDTITPTIIGTVSGSTLSQYNIVDNVYYPANARGVKFTVARAYIGGAPMEGTLTWTARLCDAVTGHTIAIVGGGQIGIHLVAAGTVFLNFDLPLFYNYALVGNRRIEIDIDTTWSAGTPGIVVELGAAVAWKMTP